MRRKCEETGKFLRVWIRGLRRGTVHEQINEKLKMNKIEEEIERWLAAARQRTDIVQIANLGRFTRVPC